MKRWTVLLCALLLLPVLAQQRPGQRQQQSANVEIQVIEQKRTGTSSQTHDLLEIKVRLTNKGENQVSYSNNMFALTYDNGHQQPVNRLRFPERGSLEAGKSVVVERIFFDVAKDQKPSQISFVQGRRPLATVKL